MSNVDRSISYIEFPMTDTEATKEFYGSVFGWEFTAWGSDYLSFTGAEVDGGFNGGTDVAPRAPGVLVVLYAKDLEETAGRITTAGGSITKPIFSFPGGRRLHFLDPNGNELAVWSE